MAAKKKKDIARVPYTVLCCQGDDCSKNGARETLKELRAQIGARDLKTDVHCIKTQCMGACKSAPMVIVCSGKSGGVCGAIWYRNVGTEEAEVIADRHLQNHHPVESLRFFQRDGDDPGSPDGAFDPCRTPPAISIALPMATATKSIEPPDVESKIGKADKKSKRKKRGEFAV